MNDRILLIDDDSLVNKTVALLLSRVGGHTVDRASNVIEALSLVAVHDYKLVISDIRMPGDNGVVAIKKIKEIYEKRSVICGYIFITGYSEEDTPAHAIRLGVDKFILKPFDNDIFLKNVREELLLVHQQQQLKEADYQGGVTFSKRTHITKNLLDGRRVVVTGMGVVCPNGIGRDAYWNGLASGMNCVSDITFFDASSFPSRMAAEAKQFSPKDFLDEPTEVKRMGRSSQLAIAASKLAIMDSGLNIMELSKDEKDEFGVVLGSAVSGLEYVEIDFRALERGGVRKVRPYLGIAGFAGAISSEISRALGINGTSLTISTGCTSATDAMGYALDRIRSGKEDLLVTGGADACITPGILAAFCQMGAVSCWDSDFQKASRPFNKDRGGFVIGEGAWVYVFEDLEHAQKRNANIYGEVVGYGATCDAWHMAKPHPSGVHTVRAIYKALDSANIQPAQVDLFEAYGNGTPINDSYETGVIKQVFGKHSYSMLIPSIKSMIGHPLGASGAQQLGAVLLAYRKGIVHPTINYEIPDPECDLNYVPNTAITRDIDVAVCSSIAFGAKNSALVVRAYRG